MSTRSDLIRKAASLSVGSRERKALLASIKAADGIRDAETQTKAIKTLLKGLASQMDDTLENLKDDGDPETVKSNVEGLKGFHKALKKLMEVHNLAGR